MLPFYGRKVLRKTSNVDIESLKKSSFFFDESNINILKKKLEISRQKINLEIGFGNGENLIYQSVKFKNELFIAVDPFISGGIKVKKKIEFMNIKNVFISNLDCLNFLSCLKKIIYNKIYILFPDPWPKKRHKKRRLINQKFVRKLNSATSESSNIFIITDDNDYSIQIIESFSKIKNFRLNKKVCTKQCLIDLGIYPTKYYNKARVEKKKISVFTLSK